MFSGRGTARLETLQGSHSSSFMKWSMQSVTNCVEVDDGIVVINECNKDVSRFVNEWIDDSCECLSNGSLRIREGIE